MLRSNILFAHTPVSPVAKIQFSFIIFATLFGVICDAHLTCLRRGSRDCCFAVNVANSVESMAGADPGEGDRPPKTYESNFFTKILYNLENSIRDIRPFRHPLFCHSSVVKYSLLRISYSIELVMRLDYQLLLKSPPLHLLARSASGQWQHRVWIFSLQSPTDDEHEAGQEWFHKTLAWPDRESIHST